MEIKYRFTKGGTDSVTLEPDATIGDLRRVIAEKSNNPPQSLHIILKAKRPADDVLISSLNLQPRDFFIIHPQVSKPTPQIPQPAPTPEVTPTPAPAEQPAPVPLSPSQSDGPPINPLPEVARPSPGPVQQTVDVTSEDYQNALATLQEFGFPRSDIEAALLAANGNADLAMAFLEGGHIPTPEEIRQINSQEQTRQQLANLIQQNPDHLPDIIDQISQIQPELGVAIRQDPEGFLRGLGIDPSGFDINSVRRGGSGGASTMPSPTPAPGPGQGSPVAPQPQNPGEQFLSRYSQEEREIIQRIKDATGADIPIIVQCFEACDKNEMMTANLVLQMMG